MRQCQNPTPSKPQYLPPLMATSIKSSYCGNGPPLRLKQHELEMQEISQNGLDLGLVDPAQIIIPLLI